MTQDEKDAIDASKVDKQNRSAPKLSREAHTKLNEILEKYGEQMIQPNREMRAKPKREIHAMLIEFAKLVS